MSTASTTGPRWDAIVVGAGVAGLSAAYFAARDARVLVLEQESHPAYHASGRSAAMFITGYENAEVAELTAASSDFFHSPPTGFANAPLLHPRGGLTVAGPDEHAALDDFMAGWAAHCPNQRRIDAAAALQICPILKRSRVDAAAFDPDWLGIDAHELVQGFLRGLRQAGGELITDAPVTALAPRADLWRVTTAKGEFDAPVVINAAGPWAGPLADLAGIAHPTLTPMRRTAAIVDAPEGAGSWPLVHTLPGEVYFKPESPGLMVSLADETPSPPTDAQPEEYDIAVAIDRFEQLTDLPVRQVRRRWAGLRTFAPDRRPLLGFASAAPGFFWLAGQGGFGVQTAPALGRLAADCALHGAPPPAALNAGRFD